MQNKPSLKEALKFWLRLGFISFGGPAGQIAIMHEFLVEKKKWISEKKFMNALNYCMILPGPEAQQLSTYMGWLLHGNKGGLLAGMLFILPSMFILLGLSLVYSIYGNIPWIYALFIGLKPAVVAIVILALIKIAKKSLLSSLHVILAIFAFIGIYFFNIDFPFIILGSILIAFLFRKINPSITKKDSNANTNFDEDSYVINVNTVLPQLGFTWKKFFFQLSIGILCWAIPFLLFFTFADDFIFWKKLIFFFTQAAFVTFGGAYAVLPYVAQFGVEKFHWLNAQQMLDGLALGETTPGPLIMVLVFVGYMAGFNHGNASIFGGTLGLFTTTYYTFLPSFLFILMGVHLIEKTQNSEKVKDILSIITAAVVGVMFNFLIYLAQAILLKDGSDIETVQWGNLIWILISILALHRFKINMILWLGISALFGVLQYFQTL